MDAHDLVARVKDLALELGRPPTRSEFEAQLKGGKYKVDRFGGYTALLKAAGLETYDARRSGRKIDNSIFERPIEQHIREYEPAPAIERKPYPRIATISDIHWPFANQRVIDRFYRFCEREKPEWVLLNGDARDQYSHSKFPRSHNVFTPKEEDELSRRMNQEFWAEIQKLAPQARCVQLMGNHDLRPLKRVLEAYPAAEDWIEQILRASFSFPGVETIFDARQELMIGDIAVFHGYRTQLGAHRDYTLYNTINGHTHRGGVVFRRIRGQTLWELNSGFAGDPEAKGLTYTPQKIVEWTPGFAFVDSDGPRFIPV